MRLLFLLFLISISGCGSGNKSEPLGPKPEGGAVPTDSSSQRPNNGRPTLPIAPILPTRAAASTSTSASTTSSTSTSTSATSASVPSGGGSAPITPPKVVVPKVKNAQDIAAEDVEFAKYSAINWEVLDDAELYKNVVDLSKYLGTGVRQDKFYPLFIGLFKVYAGKLGSAFAYFKGQIEAKYRLASNTGWPTPANYMTIIGFKGGKYQYDTFDAGNQVFIPLILRVLAEDFPDLQLFGQTEFKTTAFQQLLMFESADPTAARLKKEMVSQLLDGHTLLAGLKLDQVGNAPWPFVKSKQAFDELVAKVPLQNIVCKQQGQDFVLNVLDCALMAKAPLDVIQEFIKDQAMVDKLSGWRGVDTYPIILAAEYSDLETFKLIDTKTSVIGSAGKPGIHGMAEARNFASLRHENLDNARYLLDKYPTFATSLSEGKSILVGLLSNDKYFAATHSKLADNRKFVKELLDKGAPMKASGEFIKYESSTLTPIAWAAKKGDEVIFKLLVEGAQGKPAQTVDIINEQSKDPQETALQQLTKELVAGRFFDDQAKKETRKMIELLINAGADLSGPKAKITFTPSVGLSPKTLTLLASLAEKSDIKLVEMVIAKAKQDNRLSAVVNEQSDKPQETALQQLTKELVAGRFFDDQAKKETRKMIKLLINAGAELSGPKAKITIKTVWVDKTLTLLASLAEKSEIDLVEMVIAKAKQDNNLLAVVNEKSDNPQETALQQLVQELINSSFKQHRKLITLLMAEGADLMGENAKIKVNEFMGGGYSIRPVIAALAAKFDEELVTAALAAAASRKDHVAIVNDGNNNGTSALHQVLRNISINLAKDENKRIGIALIKAGATVDEKILSKEKATAYQALTEAAK